MDFGGSDAPLTDAQIVAAPGLILFPETLGGVAVTYNVPGISANTHLNFTGLVLVEIYNGTITNWNDARIQSINSIPLPSTPITTVHRSDGSGTTYAFQNYLAAVNTWWNATYHYGTAVNWPVTPLTAAGSGNQNVAGAVSNTPGAIGYVDVIFAIQQSLGVGAVQNRVGNFIQPTLQGIIYAAANETVISSTNPTDLRQHIVNARGAQSYPIATYTYILVYKELSINPHTSKLAAFALAKFFWWIIGPDGQSKAPALIFAQLPSNIVSGDQTLLRLLTWAGQQIITS